MQNNIILYITQDKKVKVELYKLGKSVFLVQDSMTKLFAFVGLLLKKLRYINLCVKEVNE